MPRKTVEPLFRRATRFTGPENRLTEILASVLERHPELAQALARDWTNPDAVAPHEVAASAAPRLDGLRLVSVRTQIETRSGKRVDLELRFGPAAAASAEDVVLWVEVKHGADLHERQLQNYLDDLPTDTRHQGVVLLAPRTLLPLGPDDVPPGVPQRTWQSLARRAGGVLASETDPIKRFLLKELLAYMKHEKLTEPELLRPEHLVALAYADEAEEALAVVCERASQYVATHWRPADEYAPAPRTRAPDFGWGYWEAWALGAPSALGGAWLDWNARNEPAHPDSQGRSLFFLSGLTAPEAEGLGVLPALSADHRERLERGVRVDGRVLRFRRISDDHERFAHVAQPEQVLVGRDLQEQADSLGSWIVAGFRALTAGLDEAK